MAPFYSKAYLSTLVRTGNRMDLVLALYEGASAFVKQAMEAVEEENDQARSEAIHRASKILMALCESLDYTQSGTLPGKLFAIYTYQLQQLLEANRTNSLEPLQSVKSTLGILLNGWKEVAQSDEANAIRQEDAEGALTRSGARADSPAQRSSLVLTA